jgi:8-oxo-dGTP pyrophosphatase MutT (NUDIX family)
MTGAYDRRRGTAIVEKEDGILVVAEKHTFLLPGGGPKGKEHQMQAAMRELIEETGLYPIEIRYLFRFKKAKIFLVKTMGEARPRNEIRKIAYYTPQSRINVSYNTQKILNTYYTMKHEGRI